MPVHQVYRTHTMTVERISRTADGQGGWTETVADVGTVVGSLQPLSGSEDSNAGDSRSNDIERAKARWVFYADLGSDVARDDVLRSSGGRRYTVLFTGTWEDDSTLTHMRVDLEEIQRGR